jgi:hypothetical protein
MRFSLATLSLFTRVLFFCARQSRQPQGGVKEGQQFNAIVISSTVMDQHNIPHGSWRDGLCNCCGQGPCHPSLCLTWYVDMLIVQIRKLC